MVDFKKYLPPISKGIPASLCLAFLATEAVHAQPVHGALEQFRISGQELCAPISGSSVLSLPHVKKTAAKSLQILEQSPLGVNIAQDIRTNNRWVCVDDNRPVPQTSYRANDAGYQLEGSASVKDALAPLRTALAEARKYRIRQTEEQGFRLSVNYDPQHMALIGKLQEADAIAFMVQVAHELEQDGLDVAQAMEGRLEYEIYMAYQAAIVRDSEAPYNGKALRAAFEAWFEIAPAHLYERDYLDRVSDILDAHESAQIHTPLGFQVINTQQATAIADMPDGTNYLEQTGHFKAQNPRYFDMMSRSNESTLSALRERLLALDPAVESPYAGAPKP